MSRLVRIEVKVETLVDELLAYVADPPAMRRNREYPVLGELGGPGAFAVRWNQVYPVLRELEGPGTLGMNREVLEVMRLDGVRRREDVASYVSWCLTPSITAAPRAIRRLPAGRPTRREAQVLRLVAAGKTNPEVAAELAVSRHTLKRHLDNLFAKLGLSSRAEAAAYALREGIV
jgi:DNA-binding CsgD family transcriptional regulator